MYCTVFLYEMEMMIGDGGVGTRRVGMRGKQRFPFNSLENGIFSVSLCRIILRINDMPLFTWLLDKSQVISEPLRLPPFKHLCFLSTVIPRLGELAPYGAPILPCLASSWTHSVPIIDIKTLCSGKVDLKNYFFYDFGQF